MEVPPVPRMPSLSPSRNRPSINTSTSFRVKRREVPRPSIRNAPPEVISNLISSFDALSVPLTSQRLLDGTPSPGPETPDDFGAISPLDLNGSGFHGSSLYSSIQETDDLYNDDNAAEPPVIRTAKPPSGFSPLTAPKIPKRVEREGSFKNYLRSARHSSTSLRSSRSIQDFNDADSIGNISIDNAVRSSSITRRTSSESKRSAVGHRSLMYIGSRERLRGREADPKRATIAISTVSGNASDFHTVRSTSPRKFPVAENPIQEEQQESSSPLQAYVPRGVNNGKQPMSISERFPDGSESPLVAGLIPERHSSLRNQSPASTRKQSRKSNKNRDAHSRNSVPEGEIIGQGSSSSNAQSKKQDYEDENEVERRIRQLKAQKLLREMSNAQMGAEPTSQEKSRGMQVRVSVSDSYGQSPTASASTLSSLSEERITGQSPFAKAHRVLGISSPPRTEQEQSQVAQKPHTTPSKATEPQRHRPPPLSELSRHSKVEAAISKKGSTVEKQDAEEPPSPLTPVGIPIDYRLALQTLEREAPPTPPRKSSTSEAYDEAKAASIRSSSVPVKTFSLNVGGRSAVARRTRSSMIVEGKDADHSMSPSSQSIGSPVSRRSSRSSSQDLSARLSRHNSSQLSATSPVANNGARPIIVTKKRASWSHPDLPIDKDRKFVRDSGAVKPPPEPVLEERISTADSIDNEIAIFLDSPRLSQKVRHPQTGRVISFSEVGDPNGHVIFCCVGMGLTRYVMAFYGELAASLKVRLITPERPGIGESQADQQSTPLRWPDDILTICQILRITKFSLLAHSAGAVYALAAALRMPQHIRGRVHLLAPWIPPSMMAPIGIHQDSPPAGQLPRSQRLLRVLPPSLLKVANSSFLSTTSASITRNVPKPQKKDKRRSVSKETTSPLAARPSMANHRRESMLLMDRVLPAGSTLSLAAANRSDPNYAAAAQAKNVATEMDIERRRMREERLTFSIWDRATANANPATDLVVCLETKQTIGFRYEDITRGVVIHHGSKDSRVPVDNVRWLGRVMRKCEVRILEGEQHGLMASGVVMSNVLTEMAKEFEDWTALVEGSRSRQPSPNPAGRWNLKA